MDFERLRQFEVSPCTPLGGPVAEVARKLCCDWHTVKDALMAYGIPLVEDPDRIGEVTALGLDETVFCRRGRWKAQSGAPRSSTSRGQGPAHATTRSVAATLPAPSRWLTEQPRPSQGHTRSRVLGLSGPSRKTFDDVLPRTIQVADPFHVVRLANAQLDAYRQRVQNETRMVPLRRSTT